MKTEAEAIIRQLNLLELLAPYGEARIVGSVALDLLVKPDIDIHLLVDTTELFFVADAIYHQLLDRAEIKEVRISDYRSEHGVKVAVDGYPGPTTRWDIDLWITNHPEATGFALTERLATALQPSHREVIMALKRHYHERGLLRDGLSRRIYLAVLENGVRTVEGFERVRENER